MRIQFSRQWFTGISLIGVIALIAGVWASSTNHPPVSQYHMTRLSDLYLPLPEDTLIYKVKISSAWANEPWTGDDALYQHIERGVDAALASSQSVGDLLEQSSVPARQDSADPQAQFRWSYLARQVVLAQPQSYEPSEANEAIAVVLARAASPKTYSYARLRFLVTRQAPDLTALGERLLQRDPNDAPVKYRLSEDYSASFSEKSQQTHEVDPKLKQCALSLVEQLIAASPSNPDYHCALAAVYSSSFADRENPEDAAKAIAAYQDYLKRASPDDYFRQQCRSIIASLQEYLAANPVPQH